MSSRRRRARGCGLRSTPPSTPEKRPVNGKRDFKRWLRNAFVEADMQVRMRYGTRPVLSTLPWSAWEDAELDHDDTRQFELTALRPDTTYDFEVQGAYASRRMDYEDVKTQPGC